MIRRLIAWAVDAAALRESPSPALLTWGQTARWSLALVGAAIFLVLAMGPYVLAFWALGRRLLGLFG